MVTAMQRTCTRRDSLYFTQSSMVPLPFFPRNVHSPSFLSPPQGNPSEAQKLLPGRAGWRMKFKGTSFELLLLSLPSGGALLNQILYACPYSETFHFPGYTDLPLIPHQAHSPNHSHSSSHLDLSQLDAATLAFCTGPQRGPQRGTPPKTSTRIRHLSPEDIPFRTGLL